MNNGFLVNSLVGFLTATFSLLIYLKTKNDKKEVNRFFGLTWLWISIITALIGLSALIDWLGPNEYVKIIFYIVEVVSYITFIFGSIYVYYELALAKKFFKRFIYVLIGLLPVYLFLIMRYGLIIRESTFFGVTFALNTYARITLFGSILLLVIIGVSLLIYARLKKHKIPITKMTYLRVSPCILLVVTSTVAQSGYAQSWQLILARMFMLISALMAYTVMIFYYKGQHAKN